MYPQGKAVLGRLISAWLRFLRTVFSEDTLSGCSPSTNGGRIIISRTLSLTALGAAEPRGRKVEFHLSVTFRLLASPLPGLNVATNECARECFPTGPCRDCFGHSEWPARYESYDVDSKACGCNCITPKAIYFNYSDCILFTFDSDFHIPLPSPSTSLIKMFYFVIFCAAWLTL
jgi:hypothetical protein